ncbi:hypothetical protein ACN2MM_02175 [Alkalilimnicola ehrlichii MLHE-1]|uniref:Uncharacterized protein n=1 Tax=Alkalilimnicola ehrlichii (strain ATCC BAA-1101 / DSM 17681 / MLHE-1) TaxID=187272 RepID=Q0ABV3_ALKEH|nr:hypothetical protein [Alkalilimnicola ehrlichii]ABI55684.1 hypothetical protein Mlg_0329 [Alkalilimnicola ehrlichii MLHE-1]
MSPLKQRDTGNDPRSVTDKELRRQYQQEQVEQWRKQADEAHDRWMDVIDNPYGKD